MKDVTYNHNGDYQIPEINIKTINRPIGKYGRMRKTYLKTHRPVLYNSFLLGEKLYSHLLEIDLTATQRLDQMVEELLKNDPAPDKATEQMAWTAHMNSLKGQAEEMILTELIYS